MDDKDVLEATGRHPDEWFAFLDAAGATGWTHEATVIWLAEGFDGLGEAHGELIASRFAAARGLTGR